ncbi:MAG: hypothetical protein IPK30_10740 [Cellvibrionales bacterium]|nr:hypothetical protein [Cellvibrionales bacterium]
MKVNHEGTYRIARTPIRLKPHNAESWEKIAKLASASPNGQLSFDQMLVAVKDHSSGSKNAPHPHQFVIYCIKSGWLKRTQA